MGIKHLYGFLNEHYVFQTLKLKKNEKINVVIDGGCILNSVHEACINTINLKILYETFENYLKAKILPYMNAVIILDGEYDKTKSYKKTSNEKTKSDTVSIQAFDCYVQVLQDLKIPFRQCAHDADIEIVKIAVNENRYILTNDTDFCIYNIGQSIIFEERMKSYGEMELYNIKKFSEFFKINRDVMSVFAFLCNTEKNVLKILNNEFQYNKVESIKNKLSNEPDKYSSIKVAQDTLKPSLPPNDLKEFQDTIDKYSLEKIQNRHVTTNFKETFLNKYFARDENNKYYIPNFIYNLFNNNESIKISLRSKMIYHNYGTILLSLNMLELFISKIINLYRNYVQQNGINNNNMFLNVILYLDNDRDLFKLRIDNQIDLQSPHVYHKFLQMEDSIVNYLNEQVNQLNTPIDFDNDSFINLIKIMMYWLNCQVDNTYPIKNYKNEHRNELIKAILLQFLMQSNDEFKNFEIIENIQTDGFQPSKKDAQQQKNDFQFAILEFQDIYKSVSFFSLIDNYSFKLMQPHKLFDTDRIFTLTKKFKYNPDIDINTVNLSDKLKSFYQTLHNFIANLTNGEFNKYLPILNKPSN